jgi:hypothetical protein
MKARTFMFAAQGLAQEGAQHRSDSEWVAIKEWAGGNGPRKTEAFAPSKKPWRVSYKATGGDRWGLLDIFVRTKSEEYVASALNMQLLAFEEDTRSGAFLVTSEHDDFVLEIISNRIDWHVAIEQPQ